MNLFDGFIAFHKFTGQHKAHTIVRITKIVFMPDLTWLKWQMTWTDMTGISTYMYNMTWNGFKWRDMEYRNMTKHDLTWHDETKQVRRTWNEITWCGMTWNHRRSQNSSRKTMNVLLYLVDSGCMFPCKTFLHMWCGTFHLFSTWHRFPWKNTKHHHRTLNHRIKETNRVKNVLTGEKETEKKCLIKL